VERSFYFFKFSPYAPISDPDDELHLKMCHTNPKFLESTKLAASRMPARLIQIDETFIVLQADQIF